MNLPPTFTQGINDNLDYSFDFSLWIKASDNIVDVTASVNSADLDITDLTHDNKRVRFNISGGVVNTKYKVSCLITTSDGLSKEVILFITIR